MNADDAEAILEKLKQLPPERLAEVEDFVDFLRQRADERTLVRAAAKRAEDAFGRVWENPADADYDRL
jgi:hypothetical protein